MDISKDNYAENTIKGLNKRIKDLESIEDPLPIIYYTVNISDRNIIRFVNIA